MQACAKARAWLVEASGLICPDPKPTVEWSVASAGWLASSWHHGPSDSRLWKDVHADLLPGNGNSCKNNSMSQEMTRMVRQSHRRPEYEACA
jgi:hypothetical protein